MSELTGMARGHMYEFSGRALDRPADRACALQAELHHFNEGACGRFVVDGCRERISGVEEVLAESVRENAVAFQDAVPDVQYLCMVEGRCFVTCVPEIININMSTSKTNKQNQYMQV